MDENGFARIAIDCALQIHRKLGPGLLETVYEVILANALRQRSLSVERQVPVPIEYEGQRFDEGFRIDLLVEKKLIIELKSQEFLMPVHSKQVLTYLRLTNLKLGLLINFGGERLKGNVERIANNLPELNP